jgi:chitin synthase
VPEVSLYSERSAYSVEKTDGVESPDINLLHSLIMVTCYSEGYDSLKDTLHSIAESDFPVTHRTIFVVADGKILGSGHSQMTHEYVSLSINIFQVLECMDLDPRFPHSVYGEPESYNYVAIVGGTKRKNFAQVYVGHYRSSLPEQRVPMILVVKSGNEEEKYESKPGNRGKVCVYLVFMRLA